MKSGAQKHSRPFPNRPLSGQMHLMSFIIDTGKYAEVNMKLRISNWPIQNRVSLYRILFSYSLQELWRGTRQFGETRQLGNTRQLERSVGRYPSIGESSVGISISWKSYQFGTQMIDFPTDWSPNSSLSTDGFLSTDAPSDGYFPTDVFFSTDAYSLCNLSCI